MRRLLFIREYTNNKFTSKVFFHPLNSSQNNKHSRRYNFAKSLTSQFMADDLSYVQFCTF